MKQNTFKSLREWTVEERQLSADKKLVARLILDHSNNPCGIDLRIFQLTAGTNSFRFAPTPKGLRLPVQQLTTLATFLDKLRAMVEELRRNSS